MICPVSYSTIQNFRSVQKNYTYGKENSSIKLSHDTEQALLMIFEKEIMCSKLTEKLKQQLLSQKDFSIFEIFRAIDKYAHGKINNDNLRVFFRNFDFCMNIEEEDIENWIRKYDRDVDFQLDYSDFVTSISP